jgi:hypothetical protein
MMKKMKERQKIRYFASDEGGGAAIHKGKTILPEIALRYKVVDVTTGIGTARVLITE